MPGGYDRKPALGAGFASDLFGGGASMHSKESAAVKIQARMRGTLGRKRVRVIRGGDGSGVRESMPMAQRAYGHPTDRELIGQKLARAKNEEQRKQGRFYAESSFDGQSTVYERVSTPKPKEIRTPAPLGMEHAGVALNSYQDLQLAFEMCDSQREGCLQRRQAQAFLKALGWLLNDEQLNQILDGPRNGKPSDSLSSEVWGLKHLVEAMDNHTVKEANSSLDQLKEAVRLLAYGKNRISRNRLVEISVANSEFVKDNLKEVFQASLGRSNFRTMAVDDVATMMMSKICNPPANMEKYTLKHA
eukprot:TRINITY_DN75360_c0_g1_i1.p1 TRINITY_DN75360_c0_g1~~TRINITY_DN75360_c0_g1_i1.p1  ORF type:complete len:303 (-),score=73.48 TRINITY_DN75360_c0_g1_i1:244-1152(-)